MKLNLPNIAKSPEIKQEPVQPMLPEKDKIESVFDSFSLNECRELYQRLHAIFG